MASDEQRFQRGLSWVQCNDCLVSYSATTRFAVLACAETILCERCVKKTAKDGRDRTIQCLFCKKDKSFLVIRHSMDPQYRCLFESPADDLSKAKKVRPFQDYHKNYNHAKMQQQNDQLRDTINRMRAQVIDVNKARGELDEQNPRIKQQLLRVMSQEKIDHYMGKSVEELEELAKKSAIDELTPHDFHRNESGVEYDDRSYQTPLPATVANRGKHQHYRQLAGQGSPLTLSARSRVSRSSASSHGSRPRTLLQSVQERNFRRHISPVLKEYFPSQIHHPQNIGRYELQKRLIRAICQKQAQEGAVNLGVGSSSAHSSLSSMASRR